MKENIILIGFMGSGKTTIGKVLARQLDMKFIDTDGLISSIEKKPISQIFTEKGEDAFRKLEREIIASVSLENNTIISTGGGVVIDISNIKNLKRNGFIVYLECEIECIYNRVKNNRRRPLLNNIENLYEHIETLYNKRRKLYEFSSDFKVYIDGNSTIFDTVEKIKRAYIEY